MSGYIESLEAAGASVLDYIFTGSYQGEWYAVVDYNDKRFIVSGSYGSCSYCDAFEAEFEYGSFDSDDYQERLAEFGRSYLNEDFTPVEFERELERLGKWNDTEAAEWYKTVKHYFEF